MIVCVLVYIQLMCGWVLQYDIMIIVSVVMMVGMVFFFRCFEELLIIEGMLKGEDLYVLFGVLQVICWVQCVVDYVQDWVIWCYDINMEEVCIVVFFYDLMEILVWCFVFKFVLDICVQQIVKLMMCSVDVQKYIIGYSFQDMQLQLCQVWYLLELLFCLIDDFNVG